LKLRKRAERKAATGDSKAVRDLAIVRTLHDLAMQVAELVALDVGDLDLRRGTLVIGKRRTLATLPDPTRAALSAWMKKRRRSKPGPLFTRLDTARLKGKHTRLTSTGVSLACRELGATPRAIRHEAIARALALTGGDVEAVRLFSRLADGGAVMRHAPGRPGR
jgi:integrase